MNLSGTVFYWGTPFRWAVPFFFSLTLALGAPPAGYYSAAEGKLGEDLRLALAEIIGGHTRIPYSWPPFYELDRDPENPDHVILIYSGFSVPHDSHHLTWNREHIWPRSRGLGTSGIAHDDLFNLTPINPGVNSARGNLAFGYPDPEHPNYVGPGHYEEAPLASRDSLRWLPPEFDRGFIARAMFYMATRYNGAGNEPDLFLSDEPPSESPWGTEMGEFGVFLDWNRRHPPTDFERRRNRILFESYQGNRNPFIDFPDLVDAAFTGDRYLAPGTWRVRHFSLDELLDDAISGWGADPDGDGINNLLEYALGLDPRVPNSGRPVKIRRPGADDTTIAISYRRVRAAEEWGLTYRLETSPDLIAWEAAGDAPVEVSEEGEWHERVEKFLPLAEAQFFRVRVIQD